LIAKSGQLIEIKLGYDNSYRRENEKFILYNSRPKVYMYVCVTAQGT